MIARRFLSGGLKWFFPGVAEPLSTFYQHFINTLSTLYQHSFNTLSTFYPHFVDKTGGFRGVLVFRGLPPVCSVFCLIKLEPLEDIWRGAVNEKTSCADPHAGVLLKGGPCGSQKRGKS